MSADYLLVLGAPRSGTTFLANLLNTHPNVACLHEYNLGELFTKIDSFKKFDESVAPDLVVDDEVQINEDGTLDDFESSRFSLTYKKAGNVVLTYHDKHFHALLASFFQCVSGKKGLRVMADKLPHLSLLREIYPIIIERLGHVKKVFIVRRPIDVVRSSMRRGMMAARGNDPLWVPRSLADALIEWTENWEYVASMYRSDRENTHVIKYEDLVRNFAREAEKLADFLDIENAFVDVAAPVPERLIDFRLDAETVADIDYQLGDLSAGWDDTCIFQMLQQTPEISFKFPRLESFVVSRCSTSQLYLRKGFSQVEDWGVWTCENTAQIRMILTKSVSNVELYVRPFHNSA